MMGSQLFDVEISVYQTTVNSLLAIGKAVIGIDKRTLCAMEGTSERHGWLGVFVFDAN
jgi:hypothetical protein